MVVIDRLTPPRHSEPKRSLGSLAGFSYFIIFWIFAIVIVYLSQVIDADTHDGYLFLLQTRRLTDPHFSSLIFEPIRPRALVFILLVFDLTFKSLWGQLPTIAQYHLLMGGICIAFVAIWKRLLSKAFSRPVARLSCLFLMASPLLFWFGVRVLADVLGGLFWGTTLFFFLKTLETRGSAKQFHYAALFGASGAFLALSKHQLVVMFSLWILGWWSLALLFRAYPNVKACLLASFFFVVVMEAILRLTVNSHYGILDHITDLIRLNKWGRTDGALIRTPFFYTNEFLSAYGAGFFALFILSLLALAYRRKDLLKDIKKVEKNDVTFAVLFFLMTALFVKLIADFPGKDTRWFIPFLPGMFTAAAMASLASFKMLGSRPWVQTLSILIFALVFMHPLRASRNQVITLLDEAKATTNERQKFWSYLNAQKCDKIEACWFQLFGISYDEPQYQFMTGMASKVARCSLNEMNYQSRRLELSQTQSPETCYILPALSRIAEFPAPVYIQKGATIGIFFENLLPRKPSNFALRFDG